MKYLVTGSSGFIGTHLCSYLKEQGHSVVRCDLKDISGDIRKPNLGIDNIKQIDGIFHLAAIASVQETIADPNGTFDTNVTGTNNVFQIAKNKNIPAVYASSAAVYGDNTKLPLSENELPMPLSPYAEHKLQNEIDARDMGIRSFGVRFFNIYGPGQDPSSPYSGVISIFYDLLKDGHPITIFGDGKHSRDFVYVADAVKALTQAMAYASIDGPIANVCKGRKSTLLELAETIGKALGKEPDIHFEKARSGDIVHSLGDPLKLERLTGFRPKTALHDGIQKLVEATS